MLHCSTCIGWFRPGLILLSTYCTPVLRMCMQLEWGGGVEWEGGVTLITPMHLIYIF